MLGCGRSALIGLNLASGISGPPKERISERWNSGVATWQANHVRQWCLQTVTPPEWFTCTSRNTRNIKIKIFSTR